MEHTSYHFSAVYSLRKLKKASTNKNPSNENFLLMIFCSISYRVKGGKNGDFTEQYWHESPTE